MLTLRTAKGNRHRHVARIAATAIVCVSVLATQESWAATFEFVDHTNATVSATDALADMHPYRWELTDYYLGITDGSSAYIGYSNADPDTMTFVFGIADDDVYVSRMDFWVGAGDGNRDSYDFDILFSDDGATWTNVVRGAHSPASSGSGLNLARFEFDPDETRGMSHVRIKSYFNPSHGCQLREIDLFTHPANRSYSVTYSRNIPLEQSAADDVNGIVPALLGASTYYYSGNNTATLTDATDATTPSSSCYYGANGETITCRWDLAGKLAPNSYLDRVDIWTRTDSARTPQRFGIAVSSDGSTWRKVADTGYRTAGTHWLQCLTRVDFEKMAVTGFRYVGVIDYPCAPSQYRHGWITEIDVFTDRPRGSVILLK